MKVEKESQITFTLKGKEIEDLKNIIENVIADSRRIGFNCTRLSKDECKLLSQLLDSLE